MSSVKGTRDGLRTEPPTFTNRADRLHEDGDVRVRVNFVGAIVFFDRAGELRRSHSFGVNFADVRQVDRAVGIDAVGIIDLTLVFGRHAADFQFNRIANAQGGLGVGAAGKARRLTRATREQRPH